MFGLDSVSNHAQQYQAFVIMRKISDKIYRLSYETNQRGLDRMRKLEIGDSTMKYIVSTH